MRGFLLSEPMAPIIETPRLILRAIDPVADLDRRSDMMSDEDTVRYIGGKTLSRQESRRQMATVIGHTQIRGYGFMSVIVNRPANGSGASGLGIPKGGSSRKSAGLFTEILRARATPKKRAKPAWTMPLTRSVGTRSATLSPTAITPASGSQRPLARPICARLRTTLCLTA